MNRTLNRWRTWVWVLPAVILLVVFVYYPIVDNIRLSLFSWSAFSAKPTFVGLDNYRTAAADPVFWHSPAEQHAVRRHSLVFQVGVLPRPRRRARGVRAPAAARASCGRSTSSRQTISITVSGILFSFIYNPQIGLLNRALGAIGLDSWTHAWLGEQGTAMWSIIGMSQWQSFGYTAVLFVVAIQRIPTRVLRGGQGRRGGRRAELLHDHHAAGARDDDAGHRSSPSRAPSWSSTRSW